LVITSLLLRMMLAAVARLGMVAPLRVLLPLMEKLTVELVRSRPRQYCCHEGKVVDTFWAR
jgi:hypothetical protein